MTQGKKKVAIVGGGISGLTAAYYLGKLGDFEITLFEASAEVGGHAHSYQHAGVNIDTTVVKFHETAYPNFVKLVRELGVFHESRPLREDLCFHSDRGVEYMVTSRTLGLLRKPFTIYRTRLALKRLSRAVMTHLHKSGIDTMSFLEFLQFAGLRDREIDFLVLPMVHLFVAMSPAEIRQMPARFMIEHLFHHRLLQASTLTAWRVWSGGTVSYVAKLAAAIEGQIHTAARIQSIERTSRGTVLIHQDDKAPLEFDSVIVATPPASALRLLKEPTRIEHRLLSTWDYKAVRMCIHRDPSVLPQKKVLRGLWNPYVDAKGKACGATWLASRVHPALDRDVMVSWNPIQKIDSSKEIHARDVEITRYTATALKSHKELPALNNQRQGIYFCGAHFGYGWHEAGVTSGLNVVACLKRDFAKGS